METKDLHRHKCDNTGKGMSEGWYIDGEYFSTQEAADKKAQLIRKNADDLEWFEDFKDLYNDCQENGETDFCYWTTWHQDNFDLEEEGEAYDDDGNLYFFKNGKWSEHINLDDYDIVGGDGVENEIWEHKETKNLIEIPIEIVRDFKNVKEL